MQTSAAEFDGLPPWPSRWPIALPPLRASGQRERAMSTTTSRPCSTKSSTSHRPFFCRSSLAVHPPARGRLLMCAVYFALLAVGAVASVLRKLECAPAPTFGVGGGFGLLPRKLSKHLAPCSLHRPPAELHSRRGDARAQPAHEASLAVRAARRGSVHRGALPRKLPPRAHGCASHSHFSRVLA